MGAHIFEQSKVSKITYGKNPAVHTEKGIAKAKYVILCGNAYMGRLEPYLDARVLPSTSCIIATQPLTEEQMQQTLPKMWQFVIPEPLWTTTVYLPISACYLGVYQTTLG